MSNAKRAYQAEMIRFVKQMKRPLYEVGDIMPIGFSDDDFIETFKKCFASHWQSIVEKKKNYDMMDRRRKHKHQQPIYYFPKPEDFILQNSITIRKKTRQKHQQVLILPDDERQTRRRQYEEKSKRRLAERRKKQEEISKYQQLVTPAYSNYFIETYFSVKHTHPEDVNTRMRILEEASKFKCKETIAFMFKVNSAERNYNLRHFAFLTLQKKFGFPKVHLHRNRKGKLHPGDHEIPKEMDTPELLMAEIVQSQYELEQHKEFDVFLSHSSRDYEIIFELKTILNSKGLTVYVDWVEDRNSLKRELTSADTARVLIERITRSNSLLYVLTESSNQSQWTPWEIGYADALGKKIMVLPIEDIKTSPAYLDKYAKAILQKDDILIQQGECKVNIKEWLSCKGTNTS